MFEGLKAAKETILKALTLKDPPVLGNNKLYEKRNKDLSNSHISLFHESEYVRRTGRWNPSL